MHNGQKGDLAEIAFIYEATQRDLLVLEPRGDNTPYDVAVDNGKQILKVQIRGAWKTAKGRNYYFIGTNHGSGVYYNVEHFDVFAVTIRPEHVWYLIPSDVALEKTCLLFYADNSGRFEKYLDNWKIFEPQHI